MGKGTGNKLGKNSLPISLLSWNFECEAILSQWKGSYCVKIIFYFCSYATRKTQKIYAGLPDRRIGTGHIPYFLFLSGLFQCQHPDRI
jgi:hypothetical protein